MKNLAFATITQLQDLLKNKEISAQELLTFYLDRFAKYDPAIGAALDVFDKDSIIAAAAKSGELAGIPGLLKDIIAEKGRSLTCASKILEGYKATYDATSTARLKDAGAYIVGRANCDEFAMGSSNETSAYKKVKNPWDHERVAGGSSGGSIAAVAAGLVPWAIGTDTGSSIRQPAAFCGVVGLKPTYGLVSRYGVTAYASSLDCVSVTARTVKDTAKVLSVIAGKDPKDATSLATEKKDYAATLDGAIKKGLKIGVVDAALHAEGMDPEIVQAIETAIAELKKLGARIENVELPAFEYGAATYFILSRAEAASNLARFDGVRYGMRAKTDDLFDMYSDTRRDGFGAEVKRRILIGNYVLSAGHADAFYVNAKKVQQRMRQEFIETFKKYDLLVLPTTPMPAFKFGAFDTDRLQMDLQDYFTCPINIAGLPAISMPCGFTKNNLPIGFQIVGSHLSEELICQTAHAYEQVTPWHTMHPAQYAE